MSVKNKNVGNLPVPVEQVAALPVPDYCRHEGAPIGVEDKGEIKITVIATGFTALNREGAVQGQTSREAERVSPQEARKTPIGGGYERQSPPVAEENEWDSIPAFLRRRGN